MNKFTEAIASLDQLNTPEESLFESLLNKEEVICSKCGSSMKIATPSRRPKDGRISYQCPNRHFYTPNPRRNLWTKEEDELLEFLVATYPRAKIVKEYRKAYPGRRSSRGINHRIEDLQLKRQSEFPDHVSRKDLSDGLGTTNELILRWESKGLLRCQEASNKTYAYYRKCDVRRFLVKNPTELRNKIISKEFSPTLIGILTGDW